jgi:nicotinamidase-related amidase
MKIEPALNPARTAVLAMDLQNGIVSIYCTGDPELIARCADVLKAARAAKMPVIHVRVGFRPGLPEISSRNPLFGAIKTSERHQQLFHGTGGDIHPALGPAEDDIVVTKHRVSAFEGTDLEMILRSLEIDTLVLFGIATSGVVLSTLLHASDSTPPCSTNCSSVEQQSSPQPTCWNRSVADRCYSTTRFSRKI